MSKCEITEAQLIDYYYGEIKNYKLQEHVAQCSTCQKYLISLANLEQELSLFDKVIETDLSNQFESNLDFVFSQAEEIESKRLLKETLIFGGVSLTLLIVVFGFFLSLEVKYFAYFQIGAYFLMPMVLLPLLKLKQEKGAN